MNIFTIYIYIYITPTICNVYHIYIYIYIYNIYIYIIYIIYITIQYSCYRTEIYIDKVNQKQSYSSQMQIERNMVNDIQSLFHIYRDSVLINDMVTFSLNGMF